MKTNLNAHVFRSLRAARRRLRMQLFLERLIDLAFCASLVLLVAAAAQRWLLRGGSLETRWLWIALVVVFLGALCAAFARRFEWKEVAKCVDRLGQTRDRFLTALTFSDAPSAFQNLAAQECRAFLARQNFPRLVPIRLPAHARFLVVPIVALALLQWEARLDAQARQRATDLAQAEVAPTAGQLEQLAREIEKTDDQARAEELQKIAEQLRKSAEQLRAQNSGAEEAAKAALRELSNLEQMLQEMQQSPANASPEEMKQLAKALEENAATKDAAQAMQAGNLAEAAKQLDEAAKQEPAKEEAEKTLREALDRLAQRHQLSAALQKLTKQMQQSQGPGGKQDQALQKLAEMLRKMAPQQGSQPGKGQQPLEQTLKNLLAALQNMKFGDGQPQPSGEGAPKGDSPPGQVTVQSFAGANSGGQPPPDSSQIPSGKPGSELDKGTTETPFGQQPGERREDGQNAALKGRLADGESLSQLLPTTGDTSKAQRRYKELYDVMAPAAQDAVVQENIPLGSRFFIKRYFESIRPKE